MQSRSVDYLIVGAGFFGSVIAERLANVAKKTVLIVDQREHIGGNCYSAIDPQTQIEFHQYGTHIFHTSSVKVWEYLQNFTKWTSYQHHVFTTTGNRVYPLPINLHTINAFFNLNLKPHEVELFLATQPGFGQYPQAKNLAEKAIHQLGENLYQAFIAGYSEKQWGMDPTQIPPQIIGRLPIRYTYQQTYFHRAIYQGMPEQGFTQIFNNLLDSPLITVELATDYFSIKEKIQPKCGLIYTGPLDRFFNYSLGHLPWRSLRFSTEIHPLSDFQGTSVMNYGDLAVPFTRIHEPRHLHPERQYPENATLIMKEFPLAYHDKLIPFYPINLEENQSIYSGYAKLMSQQPQTFWGGRLGSYAYLDMDQTISQALALFKKIYPH